MKVHVEWTAEGGANGLAASDRRELHPLSAKRICWYAKASGRFFGKLGGTADIQSLSQFLWNWGRLFCFSGNPALHPAKIKQGGTPP